jgi:putative ABC transport system permease protein
MRKLLGTLGKALVECLLAIVHLIAFLLAPFRIGRLLRVVSLPRFHEHRLRTTVTIFGVTIGVAVLVAVVLVNRSILGGVSATVDDLGGAADLQVSGGTAGIDETLVERTRAVPGVWKAVPVIQQTAILADARLKGERLMMLGSDFLSEDDKHFRRYASTELPEIEKDPLAFLDATSNIILGRGLAKRLGLSVHDKISVSTAHGIQQLEIWGLLEEEGVGSAFGGAIAVMYYPALQATFDRGHNIDRIDVALRPGADAAKTASLLKVALGDAYAIEPPARKGDRVAQMLKGVNIGLSMASAIALVVGMFLIYNTVTISVVQRRRELGTLRALGMKRGELLRLIMLEATLLGSVGSALGVALGVAISRTMVQLTTGAVNKMFLQVAVSDVQLDYRLLVGGFALGTLAATLAATVPAFRAGRTSPIATLRAGAVVAAATSGRRVRVSEIFGLLALASTRLLLEVPKIAGLPLGAFAAVGALLLGGALLLPRFIQFVHSALRGATASMGAMAMLANDNLPRDLGRTASTASALMVCVAMTAGFGAFIEGFSRSLSEWADQTFPGDIFITNADPLSGVSFRNVPMAESFGAALEAIPGVARIRRIRVAQLEYGDSPVKVISTDVKLFATRGKWDLLEGAQTEVVGSVAAGAVVVSENFSRHFGTHKGDRITLSTRNGSSQFEVAGVTLDYTSDIGTILLDRATYVANWADSRVDTFELHVAQGADVKAVQRQVLERYSDDHDLFVLTNREFHKEVMGTMDQVFALTHSLEFVAILVAVLGVLNALLASVLDRVREIGVMRALGTLRAQARRMIMIEAGLVGAIGVSAGVLVGIGLGHILLTHINLAQTGWYFPYVPPWRTLLETAVLVIPTAMLAGYYPARITAAMRVTEALGYE